MKADAHEQAILLGGMSTDATFRSGGGPVEEWRYDCQQPVVASVDHVLWDCTGFAHLRQHGRPTCDCAARIGWNQQVPPAGEVQVDFETRLAQMSLIRQAEAVARMERRAPAALRLRHLARRL